MPTVKLNYDKIKPELDTPPQTISTPFGLCVLDIQGVMNLPKEKTSDAEYIKVQDIHDAVRFGRLSFDARDNTKVTLIIGNSQRLVGSIVTLDTPLGLLKVPTSEGDINMVDIIHKKIVFKHRPLPIM